MFDRGSFEQCSQVRFTLAPLLNVFFCFTSLSWLAASRGWRLVCDLSGALAAFIDTTGVRQILRTPPLRISKNNVDFWCLGRPLHISGLPIKHCSLCPGAFLKYGGCPAPKKQKRWGIPKWGAAIWGSATCIFGPLGPREKTDSFAIYK